MADYSKLSKEQLDAIIAAEGDTSRMDPEIVSGISKSLYGYTPPEPEGQGAFGSGIDRMQSSLQTAGATVADRVGLAALSKNLQASAEANKKEAATWRPEVESYRDIGGVGDAATFVKEQALSNLPYIGGVLGAGALGVAAAPATVPAAAAALAGSAAFTFPIFVGSNIDRQMEEMGVDLAQTDLTKASATAAAQTALEVTIDRFLPGVGKAISRAGGFKVIPSLARNSVEAGVVEGLTESGQQALEILQANPEKLFSMERETADEIINAAIAGVALGGALGGTMGTIRDAQADRDARELEGEYERLRQELGARQRGANKGFEEYVDEQMNLAAEIAADKEQETKQDSEELSNLLPPPSTTPRRRDTPEVDPNNVPEEELEIVQTDDGFSVRGKDSGVFHKGRMRTREEAQTYKANLEDEIANRYLSNKIYEALQDGDFDTARNTLEAAKAEPGKYNAEQVESEFRKLEAAEGALNQVLAPINGRIAAAEESLVDFKGSKTSSAYKHLEERLAGLKSQRAAIARKMAEKQGPFVPPPASREPIETERPNLTSSRDIPYAERASDIQTTYEVREVPVKGRGSKSRVYRISKKGKKIPLKGEMDAEQAARYRDSLEKKYKGTKYVVEETKGAEPSFVLFKQERNSSGEMLGEDAVDSFSTEQEAKQKAQEASGISQRMQDQPPNPTKSQQYTVSLRKLYSKLLGQDGGDLPDALRVEASEVLLDPEGSPVEGIIKTTRSGEILVRVAARLNPAFNEKEALDAVMGVGRHEFIHVLRELNVLTPDEWNILTQAAKDIKRPGYKRLSLLDSIQEQYRDAYNFDDAGNQISPEQKAELLEEEAVAELFRMWAQNPAILNSNPKAKGIIARIVDWLMGIKDSPDIKELANRVLTDIESGEVGARYVPPKRPGKGVATAPQPATYTNEAGETNPIEGYDEEGNRLFSRMSVAKPDPEWRDFEVDQVNELMAAPVFYSELKRGVNNLQLKSGNKDTWLSKIRSSGAKKDEIKWSGLAVWLNGFDNKKVITKQEVLDYLEKNKLFVGFDFRGPKFDATDLQVQREEYSKKYRTISEWLYEKGLRNVQYFKRVSETSGVEEMKERLFNGLEVIDPLVREDIKQRVFKQVLDGIDAWDKLESEPLKSTETSNYKSTVWDTYAYEQVVEPGGERNREVLIRISNPTQLEDEEFALRARPEIEDPLSPAEVARKDFLQTRLNMGRWVSNHWLGKEGVVAHIRMNDRENLDGGKDLHLEEIQSDLHQMGRKDGYYNSAQEAKREQLQLELSEINRKINSIVREAREIVFEKIDNTGPEDFQTNPRPLAYILQSGSDEEILDAAGDQTLVSSYQREMEKWESLRGEINSISNLRDSPVPETPFDNSSWAELALKRALRYATDNGYDSLSWTHSSIQDKRYKGQGGNFSKFYDEKLPKYMRKLLKQWGGDVKLTNIIRERPTIKGGLMAPIAAPHLTKAWVVKITPEMREGASRGFPLFSKVSPSATNPVRGRNNSPFVGSAKLPDGKYNVELLFGQHSDDPVATGMSNFGARHILAKHGSEIAEATGQKNILKVIESFLTALNSGHRGITDITSRGDTKAFKWERKDFKWPIVIHFFKRGDNKLSLATMFPKQYGEDRFESRIKDMGASQEDIAQFRANRITKEISGPKYSIGFKSYHIVDRPELQRILKDGRFNVYLDIYEDGKRDGYDDPFAYIQMAIDADGRAEVSTFPYGRMKSNVAGVKAVKEIIKQIKKLYPNINEMFGERVTGARGANSDSFEKFARGEITEQQYEELTTQRMDVSKYSLGIKIDGSDAVYNAAARIFNPAPEMTIWQSVLKRAFGVEYDKGDTLGRAIVRNFAHNQLGSFIFDKQYRDMMMGMGSMPDKMLSGKMLELATQMAGRSEALVHFGPLTYDRETGEVGISEDVEGLADIFSALDPEATISVNGTPISEVQAYGAYAVANRERDLRANGRIGFIDLSNAEIEEIINSAPSHFKEVFEKHQSFNEKLIDFAVATELISGELRENLLSMSYIPFYRKIDKDAENPAYHGYSFSSRLSESLNNPKALTKELIGGEQNIQEDILEMIGRNAISIVKSGLANQALIRTAEQIDKLNEIVDGPPQWGYRVDKPEDGGMNMVFRKGGEEVIYKIVAPDLWYSLISLQPQQVNGVVAVMSNFTNILRQGITHFPGYMLANLWRGKFEGYVKAGIPLTSVGQSFSKMKEVLKNDPSSMAIALKVETGMGGYNLGHMRYNMQGLPESGMTRALKRELRNKRRAEGTATYDWATTTQDKLANFWEMTTRIGEATELAERLVLAERLMEQGVSKKEAMWQALNLINYGRKGAGGSQDSGWIPMAFMNLIPMVPFLNSRIQGLYRMWENPDYQKASWATLGFPSDMFMRGLLLVAIEAGLWSIFSNDDRWDEERLDRKVNYNILYAGDKTIYLPRAFEIGAIFGAFPGLTFDAIKKRDGEELAAGTAQIFLNTLSFNPIPQGVKPAMETWMNFNTFTGRPIESTAQQRMLPEDRYNSQTSYIARMIGGATGSSPIKIDHLITGYLGSLGGAMLATVDTLGQAAGGFPTRPDGLFGNAAFFDPVLGDIIGLSRFIRADDQRANKFIGEFYDLKREIGEIHSSSQEAMLRGQVDYAQELISENKKKLSLRIPINRVAKRLGDINRSIRTISNDPNMSSGDKRRKLARLRKQKDELARRLVEMVKKAGGA
jgi:hypothetical protein